ncbi:MAG: hypothetical protein MRQ09_02115 [Candidatus Midichloria sp.]|nr:hypothetical protein [Candidatus Midichloria sp.]
MLSNSLGAGYGVSSGVKMKDALSQIADWVKAHPKEVLFLKIEDNISLEQQGLLNSLVKEIFDPQKIFTATDLEKSFAGKWPSLNSMSEVGKQLVIMPQQASANPLIVLWTAS